MVISKLAGIAVIITTLVSGSIVEADNAFARSLRKEVYSMKSGTRITSARIKEAKGAKKFFCVYKIKKGDKVYKRIRGKSLPKSGYNVKKIRYIKVLYRDFKGKTRIGELIVAKKIAKKTKKIFYKLYKKKYKIRKMELVDNYFPKKFRNRMKAARIADDRSVAADNTSAFNYRFIQGTRTLSKHSYGRSIDVNPFENPYCFKRNGKWVLALPKIKNKQYLNRTPSKSRKHMIRSNSYITKVFRKYGFRWLGTGSYMKDYQHFEY